MMTPIPACVALSYPSVFVRANPQECIRISRQGCYADHNTGGHGRAPTVFWGSRDCQGQAEFSVGGILPKPCAFWMTGADPLGTDATRSKIGMRIDLVIQAGTCYWEHDLKKIVLNVTLPIDTGRLMGVPYSPYFPIRFA